MYTSKGSFISFDVKGYGLANLIELDEKIVDEIEFTTANFYVLNLDILNKRTYY